MTGGGGAQGPDMITGGPQGTNIMMGGEGYRDPI